MIPSATRFKLAAGVVVVACLMTTLAYYYYWRAGYTSDTALAGLMAKSVLDRGERPIFFWQIGYQGTLEVYATALFFKIFGIGPRVLNLWQLLCFWLMLSLFYAHVRRLYDAWLALLAVLFLAVSTPFMYVCAMRTQPNYTETFVMGLALLGIGRLLLHRHYVQDQVPARTWRWWVLFGFVFGFGMYTYAQIIYFVGAIALQLLVVLARELRLHWQWRTWQGALMACVLAGAGFFVLLVLGHFVVDAPIVTWGGLNIPTPQAIKMAAVVTVAAFGLWWLVAFPGAALRLMPQAGAMIGGFIVGWSPQIYYTWILQAGGRDRTAFSGTLNLAIQRWGWGLDGMREYFGIGIVPNLAVIMVVLLVAPLLLYVGHIGTSIWRFVRGDDPRHMAVSGGALALIPCVALPLFSVSQAVEDLWSTRYLLVLWFWFALALAWSVLWVWRRYGRAARWLCGLAVTIVLAHNAYNLEKRIADDERTGFTGERAVAIMQARGLKYGYANYWAAYAVDFFTHEDIILQPITSAYCPFYGPLVADKPRIAFLDQVSHFREHLNMLTFGRYRVTDVWQDGDVALAVLERLTSH